MSTFQDAIQNSKEQLARSSFEEKLHSFEFLSDVSAIGKSLTLTWICFIISALASLAWYFCCYRFDAAVVANGMRVKRKNSKKNLKKGEENVRSSSDSDSNSSDDSDEKSNKKNAIVVPKTSTIQGLSIIGRLRIQNDEKQNNNNNNTSNANLSGKKPSSSSSQQPIGILQSVCIKLTSSRSIFGFSIVAVWPSWIAFVLFLVRFMHEHTNNSNSSNSSKSTLTATLVPTLMLIVSQCLFGICSVVYIVRENLSAGILTHLVQLWISFWILLNPLSSPLHFQMKNVQQSKNNNNNNISPSSFFTVHPHPLCSSLQFLSILASFIVLTIFVLMFVQLEMRNTLKQDYPQMIEILEKALPEWLFPKEKIDKNAYIKSLIQKRNTKGK